MHKRIALVTGASSGIGEALSLELVNNNWQVIGVARSKEKLNALGDSFPKGSFFPYHCDVSDAKEVEKVSSEIKKEIGIPSLFFLNAGTAGESALEPDYLDPAFHQHIFDVNYFGVLHWVKAWEKACQNAGGATFMVTGSVNAFFSPPRGSAYSASKAAIARAFQGMQLSYANTNLNFSVVFSGAVDTQGLKGNVPFKWSPERMAKYMIKKALQKKPRSEPSLFYSLFSRLMGILPKPVVLKLCGIKPDQPLSEK